MLLTLPLVDRIIIVNRLLTRFWLSIILLIIGLTLKVLSSVADYYNGVNVTAGEPGRKWAI